MNNVVIIITSFILLVFVLAAGFYWQYSTYLEIKKLADDHMEEARYTEAKIEYNRALNVPIPKKTDAIDSLARCDYLLSLKPDYDKLVAEGDSYFNLGINNYDAAFSKYAEAKIM